MLLDYEMPVINGKQVLSLKPDGYILKTTSPEQIVQTIDEFFIKKKAL